MPNTADLIECAAEYAKWVHTDHEKLMPMIHRPVMEADARQAIAIAFKAHAVLKVITDLVDSTFSTEAQPCGCEALEIKTTQKYGAAVHHDGNIYSEAEARWLGTEMLKAADELRDKEDK